MVAGRRTRRRRKEEEEEEEEEEGNDNVEGEVHSSVHWLSCPSFFLLLY